MKLFLVISLVSFSAFAERVVLRNPTVQGRPIYSHVVGAVNYATVRNAMAHTVCRLAGYPHAALVRDHDYDVVAKTTILTQPGGVFDPHSVLRDQNSNSIAFFTPSYHSAGATNLNPSAQPRVHNINRVDPCAEIAQCRHFDPSEFRLFVSEYSHNMNHPFIRQCLHWARSGQPMVFSEVTCESAASSTVLSQEVADFHEQSQRRFTVESTNTPHPSTQVRNPQVTCQSRAAQGSLAATEMMSCDYDFLANGVSRDNIEMETFLMLTGRAELQPKTGPACVQNILTKYAPSVVAAEYRLGDRLNMIKRPFCVANVGTITRTQSGCNFQVQTRDMLQVPVELSINLDSEGGSSTDRCQELADCFAHRELSCETANFCPAPGTIQRSTR